MSEGSVAPGNVRIRVQTEQRAPAWTIVGPFSSLSPALQLTQDLLEAEPSIRAIRVEHYQRRGGWKSACSFSAGAAR
jgi:hypothetical protein